MENIDLSKVKGLLATTHGKLVNSETRITATLIYDALFFSCKPVSVPIVHRHLLRKYGVCSLHLICL